MKPITIDLPKGVEEKHLTYLDRLRESGVTNMFGASPYLSRRFSLDRKQASAVLSFWMETFSQRFPQ
jgi:hypothetical protein